MRGTLLVLGLAIVALGLEWAGFFDRQIGNVTPETTDGVVPNEPMERSRSGVYHLIKRDRDGHFYVSAWVNGDAVRMLVDTGASHVMLSRETAANLGYDLWDEEFNQEAKVADGDSVRIAAIVIAELEVGDGVIATDVPAVVIMEGDVDLLGMSFLRKIGGFSVSGDEMILEAK